MLDAGRLGRGVRYLRDLLRSSSLAKGRRRPVGVLRAAPAARPPAEARAGGGAREEARRRNRAGGGIRTPAAFRLLCALLLALLVASFLSATGRASGSGGPLISDEAAPIAFTQFYPSSEADVYEPGTGDWATVAGGSDNAQGTWSPDHQLLAYSSYDSDSGRYDLDLWDGFDAIPLAQDSNDWSMRNPVWSPDGKWIAWDDPDECCDEGVVGFTNVATGATTDSNSLLGFEFDQIQGPVTWSPDSDLIVFGAQCDGGVSGCSDASYYNLFSLNVATGALTQLTTGSNYFGGPSWDPAGGQLFYYDFGNDELCYMPAPEDGTGGSGCYSSIDSSDFAWAPDGDWAALDSSGTLYVDGSQVAGTGDFAGTDIDPFSWSPDSKYILTTFGGLVDASTGDETWLDSPLAHASYVAWSSPGYRPAPQSSVSSVATSDRYGSENDAEPGVCDCWIDNDVGVNPATGEFSRSWTDASVSTFGPQLDFARSYDSSLAAAEASLSTPGPLGYGWTDNWASSLSVSDGVVTVTQANGATATFTPPADDACPSPLVGPGTSGTYCAAPYTTASLTYDSDTSKYTFITHPYEKYTFNDSGQLVGEASPGGASLSITYDSPSPGVGECPGSASTCETVTSASGRTLLLAFNSSGFVTKVDDPLDHAWTYAYCSPPSDTCSSGDLVSVTDPESHVTTFTYDEGNSNPDLVHDLLTVTAPNGQSGGPDAGDKLVNVYNASGQVTSSTDADGYETSFDYSGLDDTFSGDSLVTDPDGNVTQYVYDNGTLVGKSEGYGTQKPSLWTYHVDSGSLLDTEIYDPDNRLTTYTYDSDGNTSSTTNPLREKSTASFNGFDEQTCTTLPQAADGCDSLSPPDPVSGGGSISGPGSAPPKYATYSEYDDDGNLLWTTTGDYNPGDASASQSRTTYTLYDGESVTIGEDDDSCTASPSSSSLPCATIDPNGVVTQLGYDGTTGDLTSTSTPDGNAGGEVAEMTYTYTDDGEQSTVTAPDGNLSGATAADFTTTKTYYDDGELHTVTVSHTGGDITARETQYGYDADGNRISMTSPRGKETTYEFDADDQQVMVTDPDSQSTLTCYDGDGEKTETVPPVGVAANSLTASSCPTSYPSDFGHRSADDATTYAYDALGDQTVITTPAPAGVSDDYETTTNTYDATGQLLRATAPPSNNDSDAHEVTAYTYDAAGEKLTKTVAFGTADASTTSYCYDRDGDESAVVAPGGNTSSVAVCASSSPYHTSSDYQTGYEYDSLGELVSKTTPTTDFASSPMWTYAYDPGGNQLTAEDPNGVTTTNTYTPLNQLSTVEYSGSSAPSVSYGYDANGNRISMTDGTGTSSYIYDPFNELTSYENGAGATVTYSYDDDGDTMSVTYPLGAGATWATGDTVDYGYDDADELDSVTDFNGNTTPIEDTADGLPYQLTLGSTGDTITTTYDATDTASETNLSDDMADTLLDFSYSDFPSGAIYTEDDSPDSSTNAAYTFDNQTRVTEMDTASDYTYSFDASGNLTTLPDGSTATYDDASELTSSTLSDTTTTDSYDADGERTQETQGDSTIMGASYNGAQELTDYSNSAADMTTASYDGDGLRQAETSTPTGGSATPEDFTWDTRASLPRLLMDSDNAYIYAGGHTPVEQVNLSTGSVSYLMADLLGSLRGVIDGTDGSLTASTAYDAWGNSETSGGLASYTPFGFTGSYTDPSGLIYLIRRYYDPQTGQFLNVDPFVDQTMQSYAYAGDDPVDSYDLDGAKLCNPFKHQCLSKVAKLAKQAVSTIKGTVAQVPNTLSGAENTVGGTVSQVPHTLKAAEQHPGVFAVSVVSYASLPLLFYGAGYVSAEILATEEPDILAELLKPSHVLLTFSGSALIGIIPGYAGVKSSEYLANH